MSEAPPLAPPDFSYTRASDYKSFFSDIHKARIVNGGIAVTFSAMRSQPGGLIPANIIEEQAEVVMSWIQLKIVVQNLGSVLEAIEKEIGVIQTPGFAPNPEANRAVVRSLGLR
jgi:hypothetical protein